MRYLVIVDHTLGGKALTWIINANAAAADNVQVDVIVPATDVELGAAKNRLDTELTQLQYIGVAASGDVVLADAFDAIRDAVSRQPYNAVIVATHPAALSRWLHLDLPTRVERELEIPLIWIDSRTDDPNEDAPVIEIPHVPSAKAGHAPARRTE
jgi:hypothetical protein